MKSDFLFNLLPAVYRENDTEGANFLRNYLKIIQFVLLQVEERYDKLPAQKGLGEIVGMLKEIFYPGTELYNDRSTDDKFKSYFSVDRGEFLEWLAGWFAFVLDEDWEHAKKVEVLSRIIPLYRKRGTKDGLQSYLELYKPGGSDHVEIIDGADPFCLQDPATTPISEVQKLGEDTILGGLPSHFFIVNISLPTPDPDKMREQYAAVKKIIDREKPVHTSYRINIHAPVLLVGIKERCRLGIDTYLGEKFPGPPVTEKDYL